MKPGTRQYKVFHCARPPTKRYSWRINCAAAGSLAQLDRFEATHPARQLLGKIHVGSHHPHRLLYSATFKNSPYASFHAAYPLAATHGLGL